VIERAFDALGGGGVAVLEFAFGLCCHVCNLNSFQTLGILLFLAVILKQESA
jgi:hypothetical protein